MKITVVTPRFTIAGVPLAQQRFARALAAQGYDVDLIIGYIEPGNELQKLKDINIIDLNKTSAKKMFWPLVKYFFIQKPQVVFSAEDHLNIIVLLASIFSLSKAKISCSSRVTPFDTYSNILFSKGWILKQFTKSLMWKATVLSCVSRDMVEQYREVFSNSPHICIYNIIDDIESRKKMHYPQKHPWLNNKKCPVIIGAGKLAEWKGFDNLINAVAECKKTIDVKLIILGDGPLKMRLNSQIKELNLEDSIELAGYVDNPLNFYFNADVFVLSSRVEGLPNVLVEAMMCGCTPVSTDCPTGPRELLQDGKYGYIVPVDEHKKLAKAIISAIDTPIEQEKLQEAVKPFKEKTVIKSHFDALGLTKDSNLY